MAVSLACFQGNTGPEHSGGQELRRSNSTKSPANAHCLSNTSDFSGSLKIWAWLWKAHWKQFSLLKKKKKEPYYFEHTTLAITIKNKCELWNRFNLNQTISLKLRFQKQVSVLLVLSSYVPNYILNKTLLKHVGTWDTHTNMRKKNGMKTRLNDILKLWAESTPKTKHIHTQRQTLVICLKSEIIDAGTIIDVGINTFMTEMGGHAHTMKRIGMGGVGDSRNKIHAMIFWSHNHAANYVISADTFCCTVQVTSHLKDVKDFSSKCISWPQPKEASKRGKQAQKKKNSQSNRFPTVRN